MSHLERKTLWSLLWLVHGHTVLWVGQHEQWGSWPVSSLLSSDVPLGLLIMTFLEIPAHKQLRKTHDMFFLMVAFLGLQFPQKLS